MVTDLQNESIKALTNIKMKNDRIKELQTTIDILNAGNLFEHSESNDVEIMNIKNRISAYRTNNLGEYNYLFKINRDVVPQVTEEYRNMNFLKRLFFNRKFVTGFTIAKYWLRFRESSKSWEKIKDMATCNEYNEYVKFRKVRICPHCGMLSFYKAEYSRYGCDYCGYMEDRSCSNE